MNINSVTIICPTIINFHGKIIDSHAHIGIHEGVNHTKDDLDMFIKSKPNGDTIEKFIVSDIDVLHGTKGEYSGNLDTLNLLKKDKHYAILASCNPKKGSINKIKKLFAENPNSFAGLKFHPEIQQLEITNNLYKPYFEFAGEHNLPCLIHSSVCTDSNGKLASEINKFSDPEIIYAVARKYKTTPFVMAHMGAGWREAHDKAINILAESIKNQDANLYADISWVDIDAGNKDHIIRAVKELKGIGNPDWQFGDMLHRLMFGTDAPLARFKSENAIKDYSSFVEDIKLAIRKDKALKNDAEKIIEDLFYNNAKKLYLERQSAKNTANITKSSIYSFLKFMVRYV